MPVVVTALYHFVELPDFQKLREPLLQVMRDNGVTGTILLAAEGVNGTIAGSREGTQAVLSWLRQDPRLAELDSKESLSDEMPFYRTKVKLKKEIVTLGVEGIDPKKVVGTYVKPKDWNALIDDPEVLLIDTRNDYEYQVGTFENAINPNTEAFRQFPDYVKQHLDPKKHKKVAMFCTGGIRCEKSTALLKQMGFEDVFHLQGGILKYLEEVPREETRWHGECFVFDNRVTVNHDLQPGNYDQCHACRLPITEADKAHPHYQQGVSCPHCYEKLTESQKQRFAERQKQIELARQRGEAHIGAAAREAARQHKRQKQQRAAAQQQAGRDKT
jgi:UPF0176 protein